LCNCLQQIVQQESHAEARNGYLAVVNLPLYIVGSARPYVLKKNREGKKEIRLSSKSSSFSVDINYCPICGKAVSKEKYVNSINTGRGPIPIEGGDTNAPTETL